MKLFNGKNTLHKKIIHIDIFRTEYEGMIFKYL